MSTSSNINRKRSVIVSKKRTSVSLEDSFWFSLQSIVEMENTTIEKFIDRVQGDRQTPNLSSNLRIAILEYFQRLAASSLGVRKPEVMPGARQTGAMNAPVV